MDEKAIRCARWLIDYCEKNGRLLPRRVIKAEALKAGFGAQALKQARKVLKVRLLPKFRPNPDCTEMEDYWWV